MISLFLFKCLRNCFVVAIKLMVGLPLGYFNCFVFIPFVPEVSYHKHWSSNTVLRTQHFKCCFNVVFGSPQWPSSFRHSGRDLCNGDSWSCGWETGYRKSTLLFQRAHWVQFEYSTGKKPTHWYNQMFSLQRRLMNVFFGGGGGGGWGWGRSQGEHHVATVTCQF